MEPTVGSAAGGPSVIAAPVPDPSQGGQPLFDASQGADALGLGPTLDRLAELAAHGRTATPLTMGLLGGPGSGKTFALVRTLGRLRDLAAAGSKAGSPFLARIHVQLVDAATLDGDIASALAAALHAGLRRPYPELAREVAQAARDPHVALRDLGDKLDEARRRLDTERRALDEAGSRRACLTQTVLFEASGAQVDAFARVNQSAIESRQEAFGIAGEPVRAFKEFVHYAAGPGGRAGLVRRSLWSFQGQGRLIVTALVLIAVGLGLGLAFDTRDGWLAQLRSGAKAGPATADWIAAHADWLRSGRSAAFVLAALAVAANLWRAYAFVTPILKGVRLFAGDLDGRRRDLDGLLAHATKRVDTLEGEVERLTRAVAEAEARAGGTQGSHEPPPFALSAAAQAKVFFDGLAVAMSAATPAATPAAGAAAAPGGRAPGQGRTGGRAAVPQRIVVALDNLDALPPERARAVLDAVHRSAGAGLVVVAAADPSRLDPGRDGLMERWIQVPVRLGTAADRAAAGVLAAHLLGRGTGQGRAEAPGTAAPATGTSTLDAVIEDGEADMLAKVAPLTGSSPRAVRQFLTLYRLARGDAPRGALAFMLALAGGGSAAEREAVAQALGRGGLQLPPSATPRLREALAAAVTLDGSLGEAAVAAASRQAARYGIWA